MLQKTRGIVFRFTKYGETSIIVNIFTEMFGLQSYIVNGVRSKSAKNKIALYQPLTLLDLVVYHKENASIMRIKEVKCLHPYQTLQQNVKKSAIAMFLNEMLNKAVKDQSHAEEIGGFLIQSFKALDLIAEAENFHLIFLIKLSRYLGFGPQTDEEVLDGWQVNEREEEIIRQLISSGYDASIKMSYAERKNVLDLLVRFFRNHIENLGEIRSIDVLKEVLG